MSEKQFSPLELIPSQTDYHDGYAPTTQCDKSGPNISSLPDGTPSSVSKNNHTGHVTSAGHTTTTDHVTFGGKIISQSSSRSSVNDTNTSLAICLGRNERNSSTAEKNTTINGIKLGPFHIASIPKDDYQQDFYSGHGRQLELPVQQYTSSTPDPANLSAESGVQQPDTKSEVSLIQPPSASQGMVTQEMTSQGMASQRTVTQETASQVIVTQEMASQRTASQGTVTQEMMASQEMASQETDCKNEKPMFTTSKMEAKMSSLMRHQHNESSDDDDVFLPNPVTDIPLKVEPNVVMETEGETAENALTTGDKLETEHRKKEVDLNKIEEQSSSTVAEKMASGIAAIILSGLSCTVVLFEYISHSN